MEHVQRHSVALHTLVLSRRVLSIQSAGGRVLPPEHIRPAGRGGGSPGKGGPFSSWTILGNLILLQIGSSNCASYRVLSSQARQCRSR